MSRFAITKFRECGSTPSPSVALETTGAVYSLPSSVYNWYVTWDINELEPYQELQTLCLWFLFFACVYVCLCVYRTTSVFNCVWIVCRDHGTTLAIIPQTKPTLVSLVIFMCLFDFWGSISYWFGIHLVDRMSWQVIPGIILFLLPQLFHNKCVPLSLTLFHMYSGSWTQILMCHMLSTLPNELSS